MGLATSADARKASRAIPTKMKVDALVSQRSMIYSFDANFFPSFNYKLLCFPTLEIIDFNLLYDFSGEEEPISMVTSTTLKEAQVDA